MIRHLAVTGDVLTACYLTAALPGSLVTELEDVNCRDCRRALIRKGICPECGEERLAWDAAMIKLHPISEGRLTMHDVEVQFHLGCENCSETLISRVSVDKVAAYLTEQRWRP